MPHWCGIRGGAVRSIVLFLTQLHRKRLQLRGVLDLVLASWTKWLLIMAKESRNSDCLVVYT